MSERTGERGGQLLFGDGASGVVSHVRELTGTPARVSVLVDGRRVATLLVQQAAMLGITPGRAWTVGLAAEVEHLEGLNRAKHDAMKRLARRARGRRELIEWLLAKGHAEAIATEAVMRLKELGLVSDERLMTDIVEREGRRGASDLAIEHTLAARGIDASEADEGHGGVGFRQQARETHGSERARAEALVERELAKMDSNRATKRELAPPTTSPPTTSPPTSSPPTSRPRPSDAAFPAHGDVAEGRRVAARLVGLLARRGHEPELAREVVLKAMRARGWEVEDEME